MSARATPALISVFVTAGALLAYDRLVVKPAQVIGIVDIAEVYRAKESEFAALLSASRTDDDRQRALAQAQAFGDRLDRALREIPVECRCLVVVKSAVAGGWSNAIDLTAALKAKVGAKS